MKIKKPGVRDTTTDHTILKGKRGYMQLRVKTNTFWRLIPTLSYGEMDGISHTTESPLQNEGQLIQNLNTMN